MGEEGVEDTYLRGQQAEETVRRVMLGRVDEMEELLVRLLATLWRDSSTCVHAAYSREVLTVVPALLGSEGHAQVQLDEAVVEVL